MTGSEPCSLQPLSVRRSTSPNLVVVSKARAGSLDHTATGEGAAPNWSSVKYVLFYVDLIPFTEIPIAFIQGRIHLAQKAKEGSDQGLPSNTSGRTGVWKGAGGEETL